MRTVKQVSELTGISVRTLHYYDEIGLFCPSQVSDSGYRMYDDGALEALQQILFFKELDFTLKDIKLIMQNPNFDKTNAFANQRNLIQAKRDRLDGLLQLLDKLVKGEKCMSFKEFDMSEYFNALEDFKNKKTEEVIQRWGSINEYDKMIETFKSKEQEIAQMAIKQYGSIEKYTQAMKKNLSKINNLDAIKDNVSDYMKKTEEIYQKLTADLTMEVTSKEVKDIMNELVVTFNEFNPGIDMGENFWELAAEGYLSSPQIIEVTDKKYGTGASEYIGKAFRAYFTKL